MQAARDLYYAYCQVMQERDAFVGVSFWTPIREPVAVPRLRRATVPSAWIVINSQELFGKMLRMTSCMKWANRWLPL